MTDPSLFGERGKEKRCVPTVSLIVFMYVWHLVEPNELRDLVHLYDAEREGIF